MKKQGLLLSFFILLMSSSMAQEVTSTSKIGQAIELLKESPLSLSIDANLESTNDNENNFSGLANLYGAQSSYKFKNDLSLQLRGEIGQNYLRNPKDSDSSVDSYMSSVFLVLAKKNLLPESIINLNASVTLEYLPDYKLREQNNRSSVATLELSNKVSINDKFSLKNKVKAYKYNKSNSSSKNKYRTNRYRVESSLQHSLSDKVNLSIKGRYNIDKKNTGKISEYISLSPAISWTIDSQQAVDIYAVSEMAKSNDQRVLAQDILDTSILGVFYSVSLF